MRVNETPFEKSLRRASVLSIRLENEISQTKKLAEKGLDENGNLLPKKQEEPKQEQTSSPQPIQ